MLQCKRVSAGLTLVQANHSTQNSFHLVELTDISTPKVAPSLSVGPFFNLLIHLEKSFYCRY